MASSYCHVVAGAKWFRLERIVRHVGFCDELRAAHAGVTQPAESPRKSGRYSAMNSSPVRTSQWSFPPRALIVKTRV